jgi:hypothetical protein
VLIPSCGATSQALLKAHPEVVQASVKELRQGRLPLQVAAVAGQLDTLRALHAAGADLEAVDADGLTALQVCARGWLLTAGCLPQRSVECTPVLLLIVLLASANLWWGHRHFWAARHFVNCHNRVLQFTAASKHTLPASTPSSSAMIESRLRCSTHSQGHLCCT